MDYIRLSPENLESEHICCAISNTKDPQVIAKKQWLAERLGEGLVFLKADARGKCFIEYIPAENAWAPIDAPRLTAAGSRYFIQASARLQRNMFR